MRPISCDQWQVGALTWYFTEYESEIGIRAFDPQGLHGMSYEPDESVFEAVYRAREIEKALRIIPWRHQRVLELVYRPRCCSGHLVGLFGDQLAGIVTALRVPDDVKGQAEVEAWAHRRYEQAHQAFADAIRETGARVA